MGIVAIGAGIAIGLAGLGIGIGQGFGLGKGLEGISKQPEAGSTIRTTMIVGMAIGVLSFVIAIILTSRI